MASSPHRKASAQGSMTSIGSIMSTSPRSAVALPESFNVPGLFEGGPRLRVLVCSCNIGNKMPTDLSHWIPKDGGHQDVIAIGMQESTFRVKAPSKKGEAEEEDADDDDDGDEESPESVPLPVTDSIMNIEDITVVSVNNGSSNLGQLSSAKSLDSLVSTYQYETDGSGFIKDFIQAHLGPDYIPVGAVRRMQMRLRVYVHKSWKAQVSEVCTAGENTGIAGLVANKGGLAVSLRVGSTSLCFVSCHLAAHEGEKYLKRRHENVHEIINTGLLDDAANESQGARVGNKQIDLDHQFHHVFWMGDLNYRLDPSMDDGLKDRPWAEQRAHVLELIKEEKWEQLMALDELQRELLQGKVLCGFQTAPCLFAPTFKSVRHSLGGYNEKRMPSYCDRVLWKSMPALESKVELSHYAGCPGFLTSDHKLVPTPELEREARDGCPRIVFSELRANDLPVMDVEVAGALSDPYVTFLTDPPNLLLNKAPPRTSIVHKNLNPEWKDSIVLLPAIKKAVDMAGAHIILTVMDWDFSSADDCIGFALLSVEQIKQDSASEKGCHTFELELLKGGLPRGWIQGKAKLEWPKAGERFKETLNAWTCKCTVA